MSHISGGDAYNILPERVVMKGTARWFRPQVGDIIEKGVHRLATGIAESFGAKAEVKFTRHCPATVNDEDATVIAVAVAESVAGHAKVKHMPIPTMGGEDFAYMLEKKQGARLAHVSQHGSAIWKAHHEVIARWRGREAGVDFAEAFAHLNRDAERTGLPAT